jgi:DNA-binding CsgD family transcriptional regulator
MSRLNHRDFEACSAALRELYAETSLNEFPDKALAILGRLVSAEHISYNDFNERFGRYYVKMVPDVPEVEIRKPLLLDHFHTYPLLEHYNNAGAEPKKTSDFKSLREFRETPIYQEFYRHVSTQHQLLFFLQGCGDSKVGFALNRWHRDFSERDRAIVGFLSPHFTQAYQNARIASELTSNLKGVGDGLAAIHRAIVLTGANGQIHWASPLACEWLKEFFPDDGTAQTLPAILKSWLIKTIGRAQMAQKIFTEFQTPAMSGHRLLCYCGKISDGQFVVAFIREHIGIDSNARQSLALTPREGEILFWISEAKTNPEIAAILNVSPRTVHKHVEHLFKKLGVENRLGAQRLGLELRKV